VEFSCDFMMRRMAAATYGQAGSRVPVYTQSAF
jgi:hypothetical protein